MCLVVIFFFKQKTAYEMRISDWSSDVCSSDLLRRETGLCRLCEPVDPECGRALADRRLRRDDVEAVKRAAEQFERDRYARRLQVLDIAKRLIAERSEEHTSELQSLMRISYAVFCLKKKNNKQKNNNNNSQNTK